MDIKTVYQTSDGKIHSSRDDAKAHIKKTQSDVEVKIDRWVHSHEGSRTLKKHKMSEFGVWSVMGEDPNCDFGGHHHNPHLGTFEGTLLDVIRKAVQMNGFWAWGSGGKIEKIEWERL